MANSPLGEIEDLTLCSYCKQPFNEGEQQPKVLSCKHHFCLKCVNTVLLKGRELYCVHCWKRTELPDLRTDALPTHAAVLALARRLSGGGGLPPAPPPPPHQVKAPDKVASKENCHTHAMPHSLWCLACGLQMCRACAGQQEHAGHTVKPHHEARQMLRADLQHELAHMHKLLTDIQHLVFKQRDFLLKILEACTTLKTQVETDLVNNLPSYELSEAREALNKARQSFNTTESQSPVEIHTLLTSLNVEKERLQNKHQEMYLQCKLDDLIRNAGVVFDFNLLKRALANIHTADVNVQSDNGYHNPILFLANYCMSQLYSRHYLMKHHQNNNHFTLTHNGNGDYGSIAQPGPHPAYIPLVVNNKGAQGFEGGLLKPGYPEHSTNNNLPTSMTSKTSPLGFNEAGLCSPNIGKGPMPYHTEVLNMALPSLTVAAPGQLLASPALPHSPQPLLRNPSSHIFPLFYFNIEVNGNPFGRILIEVRNDVAPKMARNFTILTTGELGIGYKGCSIFQCWENESIITGDFELNNGRGGRSIFEESFFMPDDTKMVAVRGSVGMRRSQKRHDNLGLVGSQFRIILREMRGFTGIFAFVVEGLELVDRISQTGDSAGKPQSSVLIGSCGKLN